MKICLWTTLVLLISFANAKQSLFLVITSQPHNRITTVQEFNAIANENTILYRLPAQENLQMKMRNLLQKLQLKPDQISSFREQKSAILHQSISFKLSLLEQILTKMSDKTVVIELEEMEGPRLLQTKTQVAQNSMLFTNMTPSTLSGLFVILFLGIMMAIGLSCMANLKTNDRFARAKKLWIGRQS